MAKKDLSNKDNVPGPLFVDTTCIDCGTCFHIAPQLFNELGDLSVVVRQPLNMTEWSEAKEAIVSCPTNSIGVNGVSEDFNKAKVMLPRVITDGIYYCGYTSADSYGASSYLIRHPEGNILVDSPRFNKNLVERIEEMGGVDLMFLTHRDDVADHEKFAKHFNCKRIIHINELTEDTKKCEIILEGNQEIDLLPFFKVIPTPGHTSGHMVLLYQDRYLFSGDHLFFDQEKKKIYASKNVNWYSWPEQVESLIKLKNYYFNWIFPGHGGWGFKDAQDVRSELEEIYRDFHKEIQMTRVSEVMHANPEFCTLETRVPDIKYLMKKYDYHEMAVVNGEHVPVGVITAEAVSDEALEDYVHPFNLSAAERMLPINVVVKKETPLEDCLAMMESNHVSSLPVVDGEGHYCGIIRKSDIIRH